jgi:tetratricopeptide (TPR) repeat protein
VYGRVRFSDVCFHADPQVDMPPRPSFRSALRPGAALRRDRALAECVAGARALQLGQTKAALERYAAGVALAPQDADIAALHGVALRGAARLHDAQRELIRAIALDTSRADSYTQLAQTYRMAGDTTQAAAAFLASAMLRPADAVAWRDAAEALRLAGRISEGLETAYHAATLAPDDPSIANTTALLLHRSDRPDDALALCERTRVQSPHDMHLALTHSMLLRSCGRYDQGWSLYEMRLDLPELQQRPCTPSSPHWNGSSLAGRHVLVRAEQGLGDQVQFVRWAMLLRAHGAARVTVQTAPALVRLLRTAPHIDAVIASDLLAPPHHVHVDLLSLPHLLRSGADMHADMVPYLAAPGIAPDVAQSMGPKPTHSMRIGLVWAGTPAHADDHFRSMPLTALSAVLSRQDVQIVVLQQGAGRAELDRLDPKVRERFIDAAPQCSDMGDTAHVMARCDVVLTVDTAVAHVAGALAAPAWVMVAQPSEWRWGQGTADSLFYPSVRILRQARGGDWASVAAQVDRAIDQWLDGHGA